MRAFLILPFLAGCASYGMSADQLAASAKDKNTGAICAQGTGMWGQASTLAFNLDAGVLKPGQQIVTECGAARITISNNPPK